MYSLCDTRLTEQIYVRLFNGLPEGLPIKSFQGSSEVLFIGNILLIQLTNLSTAFGKIALNEINNCM